MITANCKINTAHIIKLNKNLIDSKIIASIKNNNFNQNEKCEFSFTIYEGYPDELQRAIEKCQNFLLYDGSKGLPHIKNQKLEKDHKLKITDYSKILANLSTKQNRLNIKERIYIPLSTGVILKDNSKVLTKNVLNDSGNLKDFYLKKCNKFRFTIDYERCLHTNSKCYFIANNLPKLKECQISKHN